MKTNKFEIIFTEDYSTKKKGEKLLVSRDLKRMFVDELKVAKEPKEVKEVKPKK